MRCRLRLVAVALIAIFAGLPTGNAAGQPGPEPTPAASTPVRQSPDRPWAPNFYPLDTALQGQLKVAPNPAWPGASVSVTATLSSSISLKVRVELSSQAPDGTTLWAQTWDGQVLQPRKPKSFVLTFKVAQPAPGGIYRARLAVYRSMDRSTALLVTDTTWQVVSGPKFFGVNVSSGAFGSVPGRYGYDYIYPRPQDGYNTYPYFRSNGLTLVRLPVKWERLQPEAFGPLSAFDLSALVDTLNAVQAAGMVAFIEPHNDTGVYGGPLGRADGPKFADFWRKLASALKDHPAVWGYELLNEPNPYSVPEGPDAWAQLAQTAADAIRSVDGRAYILVPGYFWQGAWMWPQYNQGLNVRDPAGRVIYSAHQYFDRDGSGAYRETYDASGAYPTIGVDRLKPFLDWLEARGAVGMVTEFGVPDSDGRWLEVLENFYRAMETSPRILGATYWAAGPWWGSYPLSVEPVLSGGTYVDRPQFAVIKNHPSR